MKKLTVGQFIDQVVAVEARRLALLEAAEHLEAEFVAGDMGPARRLLRCDEVCGIVAPESSVAAVVSDLRRMAKAAAVERARLLQSKVETRVVDGRVAGAAVHVQDDDKDEAGQPRLRMVT